MKVFFTNHNIVATLWDCQMLIEKQKVDNQFESERNTSITCMIKNILENTEKWDGSTQLNINLIGDIFLKEINNLEFTKIHLDLLFSSLFRFSIENYITTPEEMDNDFRITKKFATEKIHQFEQDAQEQISYALYDMSLTMFKRLYNQEDLAAIREFSSLKSQADKIKNDWNEDIKVKELKISEIRKALTEQLDGYNFVGLHAGFAKLGRIKAKELFWSRMIMLAIGLVIPISILTQAFIFYHFTITFNRPIDLIKALPGVSVTLLLIYYFRVSLSSYASVRAQIMQIELRKSLCRFIQRYSEYSEGMNKKSPTLLAKFEDVIFSNIMTSEDKIPSTFDGVEQIANLISSLKSK